MKRLYICKTCKKPESKQVKGKPRKGKKLIQKAAAEDLKLEVVPCSCLGKCKKGPNGLLMPGKQRLHRLSLKTIRELSEEQK
jgi:predicted metal-binding protein